jgi:hypothetical protein
MGVGCHSVFFVCCVLAWYIERVHLSKRDLYWGKHRFMPRWVSQVHLDNLYRTDESCSNPACVFALAIQDSLWSSISYHIGNLIQAEKVACCVKLEATTCHCSFGRCPQVTTTVPVQEKAGTASQIEHTNDLKTLTTQRI